MNRSLISSYIDDSHLKFVLHRSTLFIVLHVCCLRYTATVERTARHCKISFDRSQLIFYDR